MISGPIFTRIMPIEQYGIVSTFISWQSVLYIVFTLNMAAGVFNNGMLEFKKDKNGFSYSLMGLANLITIMWLVIYLLLEKWLNPILDMNNFLIFLLFIYCLVTPAYNYWIGMERYEFRYKMPCILMSIISITSTVLGIIIVLIIPDELKASGKIFATELPAIIVGGYFSVKLLWKNRTKNITKYWKYALMFNGPLLVHYLSMYVLSSSDRIMISKLVGTSETAIYNVAYTVASIILIFEQSVEASYAPWVYQKIELNEFKAIDKRGQQILLLFGGTTILCSLFAPEIIGILAPKEYGAGIYIVPSVAASVYFTTVYALFMRVELYYKKTTIITVATVISAIINIVLNYLLIPRIGFIAAGYTTLVSYLFLAVFHGLNLKRIGKGYIYNLKKIGILSVAILIISFVINIIYDYLYIRVFLIIMILMIAIIKQKGIRELIKKE